MQRDWLGLWTGGPASLWVPPWEEAEQIGCRIAEQKQGSSARPRGWTASLQPALAPERLTSLGGYFSASQLCSLVLPAPAHPQGPGSASPL